MMLWARNDTGNCAILEQVTLVGLGGEGEFTLQGPAPCGRRLQDFEINRPACAPGPHIATLT